MSRTFKFEILKSTVEAEIQTRFPTDYTNILTKVFGSNATPPPVDIIFDRSSSRSVNHRVLTARFGDGYEQRVRNGIHNKEEMINFTANNRIWQEIEVIAAFFDVKAGLKFDITVSNEVLPVVCESYNISYTQPEVHSITAEFRRVYEQ